MSLVFDVRASLGDRPGVHALLVGVSGYRHLPPRDQPSGPYDLKQLSSAATSTLRLFEWLQAHRDALPLPLATCRLLLTPSAGEAAAHPSALAATRRHVERALRDWRRDARSHADGMTLFYFAGHGIQRSRDNTVLLLEEFAEPDSPVLEQAIELQNIFQGMAPSPQAGPIARQQVYFIDTCRVLPDVLKNFEHLSAPAVFDVELVSEDNRCAPIFQAALPGTKAYGRLNETSLFCEALLAGLDGRAATPGDGPETNEHVQWVVSVSSLSRMLVDHFKRLASEPEGVEQTVTLGGQILEDLMLHQLLAPPSADLTLEVDPLAAVAHARVNVVNALGQPTADFPHPLSPYPLTRQLEAGYYTIGATIDPPHPQFVGCPGRPMLLTPPRRTYRLRVSP
ncbi:caspase family protein [Pyxidicoccus sp. MSG2]|uniref:caspase family protein n=1 Tax=Pyxidicoccus sp. MSG2 TaxID=2996790 RepID=UPI00227135DC|nr:caspase family protein [Pyxidicoccus sp. MSG2]MCY1021361.1 caspase family protein [Pyxidicoccus sp. MSG2]